MKVPQTYQTAVAIRPSPRPVVNASTLFMLVSALMGLDRMKDAYAHAIENGYRFYSYGDASLLLPRCAF